MSRRVTRRMTRNEKESSDETESDQQMSEYSEESNSEESVEPEYDLYADDDEDEEEEEMRPRPQKSIKRKPKKNSERYLSRHEMFELCRKKDDVLKYTRSPLFRRSIVNKFVKVESGDESYVALVDDIKLSEDKYQVGVEQTCWYITISSTFFSTPRIITIADLSNTEIKNEDYLKYVKDFGKNGFGKVPSGAEAKKEEKVLELLTKQPEPNEDEMKEHDRYNVLMHGENATTEELVFQGDKKKQHTEETVKKVLVNKMEEEILPDHKFTDSVFQRMENAMKRCDEMENHITYQSELENDIRNCCKQFFDSFVLPTSQKVDRVLDIVETIDENNELYQQEDKIDKYL
ncbi:Plus3 domain-containing protein [Entamoeba marina]